MTPPVRSADDAPLSIQEQPGENAPSRTELLMAAWRSYFVEIARRDPPNPAARDYMVSDLQKTLGRLIPDDASVLEVGCGRGDLIAATARARAQRAA